MDLEVRRAFDKLSAAVTDMNRGVRALACDVAGIKASREAPISYRAREVLKALKIDPPSAGERLPVATIDKAMIGMPASRRMEIKATLSRDGVID
jgi:hypothetical protein